MQLVLFVFYMHTLTNFTMFIILFKQHIFSKVEFIAYQKGFVKGSPRSILLAFSQSYIEHDLRKNKIVVPFFC
jgi:hypothetical protein